VARVREASVSIIRFTHSICIGFRGDYFRMAALQKAIVRVNMFTVSWNCRNLRIESQILRPHFMAVTIDAKLSSSRTIPDAYFAIYVPVSPMAKPMSAFFRAGASFVPLPVIATTW